MHKGKKIKKEKEKLYKINTTFTVTQTFRKTMIVSASSKEEAESQLKKDISLHIHSENIRTAMHDASDGYSVCKVNKARSLDIKCKEDKKEANNKSGGAIKTMSRIIHGIRALLDCVDLHDVEIRLSAIDFSASGKIPCTTCTGSWGIFVDKQFILDVPANKVIGLWEKGFLYRPIMSPEERRIQYSLGTINAFENSPCYKFKWAKLKNTLPEIATILKDLQYINFKFKGLLNEIN